MEVLHAHWQPPRTPGETGGVLFWGETAVSPPKKRNRRVKKTQPHPFALPEKQVNGLLGSLLPSGAPAAYRSADLWLPTGDYGPQPSPHLLHEWDLDLSGNLELLPWRVQGLWLPAGAAFELLLALPEASLPPTLRLGDTVRYWRTVANLVLETIAQQKVMPGLVEADKAVFEARWLPVLDGPKDGPRLARLRQAMPPLCRAEAPALEQAMPPRAVLDTFLNSMIDALARQWGRRQQPALSSHQQEPGHHWLRALFADKPRISSGSAAQWGHTLTSYRAWLRNLHVAGDNIFRTAFRLEAPAQSGQKATWQLHFLLQARDDPSLLLPAAEVWRARGSVLNALNRRLAQPQEKLLAGLGYAARFFEPVRQELNQATPTRAQLTSEQAYTFLREAAPLLEQSGFGVLVPPWWNKPGTRLGVRLKLSGSSAKGMAQISSGLVSLESLVRYQWELAIGDTPLTREEFQALVALKSPLVQIRGQWVQLDPEQIEAAIRFWEKQKLEDEISLPEALRLGLDMAGQVNGLPVEQVQFDGWLQEWVERLQEAEKLEMLPLPQGLKATLRPYQRFGYSWLEFLRRMRLGGILADDMGLGKTIQTLTLLLKLKEENGALPAPLLLICPTSVVTNWDKERRRFTPALTALVHQGPDRLRDEEFIEAAQQVDMVLTSYALVRRDAEFMDQVAWLGVVLDEAQNIKNPETKQARTIRDLEAGFRFALTGTPVENRLSELWSLMHFLNPGYLGSRQKFRQNFALPIERYGDEEATRRLRRLTQPFVLRRVKTDPTVIQDLPDKQETKVYCHLSAEQATLYQAVVQEAMQQIEEAEEGIARKGLVLSMLMKLKQVCNHPAQFLHQAGEGYAPNGEEKRSGKLARLDELLEEILAEDDRALIFTQFAEMGHLLKHYFQERLGVPALFLHGGVPARKREALVQRFQEDPDGPPLFILSLKAGGTGLNLTRANHVFHFDRWWNPAVEDQATDRAFRIGQQRNVLVHKFVCLGTLEEKIDEMIEQKKALAQSVVGSGENWLTEMSTADLRQLVALRREAIA